MIWQAFETFAGLLANRVGDNLRRATQVIRGQVCGSIELRVNPTLLSEGSMGHVKHGQIVR